MITHSSPVRRSIRRTLKRLGNLWVLPELEQRVDISFNRRLRSQWGQTTPTTGKITLHADLENAPRALLREVLCHEAAHVAVYWLHGTSVRPHGDEWANLVRRAGYIPLTKLPAKMDKPLSQVHNTARRYEHLCPVCQVVRIAGRPMRRWRCQTCIDSDLPGNLEIQRLVR